MAQIEYEFDFICLSESKIKTGNKPKTDITIDNYQDPVGTPTKALKGGVLIYIKNCISFKQREDLTQSKEKELESYFIEIINERKTNSIVGVIYRHPCMDQALFIEDYMKPMVDKLQNENKKLYICGAFNFDLLNLDHNETSDFFETMS